MNPASSSDLIRNLAQMLKGETYHRTLNAYATRYYLDNILKDRGVPFAQKALRATRAHAAYYEGVTGARALATRRVCDEFEAENIPHYAEDLRETFELEVAASSVLSPEQRKKALHRADGKARARIVPTKVYDRCPHVVAEVLIRASGVCEGCKKPAPFVRKKDGTPYLEVHHIIQLADGGPDRVENAKALCPNCHRESHFG